jgi:hypothetical protein
MSTEDFEIEQPEVEEKPRFRDRNRGRSQYIRRAIVKIFRMSPEDRAKYKPENGFEEAALSHFERCLDNNKGNAAMGFVMNALGEATSKNAKEEKPDGSAFQVMDDLPRAPAVSSKAN